MHITDLKRELHTRLPSILPELFPNGHVKGSQFCVGNINGDKGESLAIELRGEKAGLWQDFATGDSGDIFHLWGNVRGIDAKDEFAAVVDDVKKYLGIAGDTEGYDNNHSPLSISSINEYPAPSATWDYTDAQGKLIASVYRYELPQGKKEFRPYDHLAAKWRMPIPRPLFNLPDIITADSLIICEGEKSAQALIDKGYSATTAMGGANAPLDKTDWLPLKGKKIIIWPDNDKAGIAYAKKLAKHLTDIVADIKCLTPHKGWAEKYDSADAIDDYLNIQAIIDGATDTIQHYEHAPLISDWSAVRYAGYTFLIFVIRHFMKDGRWLEVHSSFRWRYYQKSSSGN